MCSICFVSQTETSRQFILQDANIEMEKRFKAIPNMLKINLNHLII